MKNSIKIVAGILSLGLWMNCNNPHSDRNSDNNSYDQNKNNQSGMQVDTIDSLNRSNVNSQSRSAEMDSTNKMQNR
jgi:hypothetical protein